MRGPNRYGCRKLTRPPLLSDEYCPSSSSVRAPPKKLTCRQSVDDARLFLGAVADAEIHLAVLAFGEHRHLDRHDRRLLASLARRLDVGEVEGLEIVEAPLALLQLS